MSLGSHGLFEEDDGKFREFDESDLVASRPSETSESPYFESESLREREPNIPEEIRESAREAALATLIREQYGGEGLVAVDRRTGEILAVEPDSHHLRSELEDSPIPAEYRLIIRCHE